MKSIKYILFCLAVMSVLSCSKERLDEIDTDPNNPTDVPLDLLLAPAQSHLVYSVVGGDMSLYAAVWVQLQTGVHAQLHSEGDRFTYTNSLVNNTYNTIYRDVLRNLDIIIAKAQDEDAPRPDYEGIALILKAYTLSVATDSWGRVPYSEALQGSANRTPSFDAQEFIYNDPTIGLFALLDRAINRLDAATLNPGPFDLIYNGNIDNWKKAANGLRVMFMTRLKNTSYYNAANVITWAGNSFTGNNDAFIFRKFTTDATGEHPWKQEKDDRVHFAVSESLFNLMMDKNDPRVEAFFDAGAASIAAPNGVAELDQGGAIYTKPYNYIQSTSPLEIMTYDQVQFALAEAHLAAGNSGDAYDAYLRGVMAALERVPGITGVGDYMAQSSVAPGAGALTNELIWEQKYISYYPFQSQEAYAEYRRTGYPNLVNPNGPIPRRMPYPRNELDNNGANVPNVELYPGPGVWWDDLSED